LNFDCTRVLNGRRRRTAIKMMGNAREWDRKGYGELDPKTLKDLDLNASPDPIANQALWHALSHLFASVGCRFLKQPYGGLVA